MIIQLFVSANYHYFSFKLFKIVLEEVARNGNVFGSRRYHRDCRKFTRCAVIFMEYGLWNYSKGFGDRKVFSMNLRIFEDYRVELLNQFIKNNHTKHGCQ